MRRRILVISSFLPSRQSGGRVRLRALMRGLAAKHSVSLLSYVPPGADAETVAEMREDYDDVVTVPNDRVAGSRVSKRALQLRSLISPRSFERLVCERSAFQIALDRMTAGSRFDVIHVEGCSMAHYDFPDGVPVVLDEQNVEYDVLRRVVSVTRAVPRRLYNYIDYLKLRREEQHTWRSVDACAVTSTRDEDFVKRIAPRTRTAVVPNAVDLERFTPPSPDLDRGTLLFFGEMGYYPNTDAMLFFLSEVLPRLRRSNPSARLVIVGPSAPKAILRWASTDVIVTGAVPDVRPYIEAARAVVVPLRVGGGTRLKILEAMAMGKPVVSTHLGAEGLSVTDERDILLADDAEAFADQVKRVLSDGDLARQLGAAARRTVENEYDWKTSVRRLEALYETAILKGSSAARAA
jgi:glycosyltransferase involved in cell wall biosynthesis